jgi:hypothetical protein
MWSQQGAYKRVCRGRIGSLQESGGPMIPRLAPGSPCVVLDTPLIFLGQDGS